MKPAIGYSVLAALLASVGCSPSIYHFEAKPNRVCSGDSVTLRWNASKTGTLTTPPPNRSPGEVSAEGSAVVAPTTTARYHLEVTNLFGASRRDVDVEVANGKTGPIGQSIADPSATCSGKTLAVKATAPAELVSANLGVGAISSLKEDKHTYRIEHAGKSAELAPGGVSLAFKGTPLAGDWALSLTLLEGETCGTPSLPRNLGIEVTTLCGGE